MLKRPICKTCNKNYSAINYIRKGKTYYRSICDSCGKAKSKVKPKRYAWEKAGYKKKPHCDLCGFKSLYPSQTTVFHIDGDLNNVAFSNLRTICLNCVEVVKKKEVTWKRGDLTVDY
jgi:YHS domain-containing protein